MHLHTPQTWLTIGIISCVSVVLLFVSITIKSWLRLLHQSGSVPLKIGVSDHLLNMSQLA